MISIKKSYLTILISTLLIVASSFALKQVANILANDTKNNSHSSYEYTLKSYDGKIAVYSNKNNSLEKVYNIYLKTLPQKDIDMLNKGIKVKDKNELNLYIQDFDS